MNYKKKLLSVLFAAMAFTGYAQNSDNVTISNFTLDAGVVQTEEQVMTQTIDLVKAAIDAGDAEEAKRLVDQMYAELAHLHDGYMCWVGGLETWIYNNHGVEELEQAERFAHIVEGNIAFKPSGAKTFKDRIKALVSGLHGHVYQPMEVTEDTDMGRNGRV